MDLKELEAEITRLEDILEIENLERIYGYYFDTRQMAKIVDLFSEEHTESVEIESHGQFLGFEGVKKMYMMGAGRQTGKPSEAPPPRVRGLAGVNAIIQIGGVVTIHPDGKTASGRWQTWLAESFPFGGKIGQYWLHGYYENKFIKENGKWLFTKLYWNTTFYTRFETGWMVQPLVGFLPMPNPDNPPTAFFPHPSGYKLPYSFPHPVTGDTSQPAWFRHHPMAT
ncbi:MAG TPA: nuclear transport factor 2 family protein [Dehalococcoidales bacterium]|nr:nuclear transport factor 2 family protein [Dehalococcoidales bacterium]